MTIPNKNTYSLLQNLALVLVISGIFAIFSGCSTTTATRLPNLSYTQTGDIISLDVKGVKLSKVISHIEREIGVQIVVPDLEDREVELSLQESSLYKILQSLLPENKPFWIVTENDFLLLNGKKGEKSGKKYLPELTNTKRDPEIVTSSLVKKSGVKVKLPPDLVVISQVEKGQGIKNKPQLDKTYESKGPKIEKKEKAIETNDYYIRMRFRIENGKFTIVKTLKIPGNYIASNILHGDYIYRLSVGNKTLATGSFRDPMEIRSYPPRPDMPHEVLAGEVGYVDIDLPANIPKQKNLQDSRIEFYRLATEPTDYELSAATFDKFQKYIKRTDSIPGEIFYKQITGPSIQKHGD